MVQIPDTEGALVLRTDFSDPKAWKMIVRQILKPVGIFRFRAHVAFLSDPAYSNLSKEQILDLLPKNKNYHTFVMVVDDKTVSEKDHPILIIDLYAEPGREFRALPEQIQGIENNLSIANMDFSEFAEAVDSDGVFRGFRGPRWRKWIFGG